MSTREKFEAWWSGEYGLAFNNVPGAMRLAFKEVAEKAWKASRAEALEEAASMVSVYLADHGIDQARECLADAIRSRSRAKGNRATIDVHQNSGGEGGN